MWALVREGGAVSIDGGAGNDGLVLFGGTPASGVIDGGEGTDVLQAQRSGDISKLIISNVEVLNTYENYGNRGVTATAAQFESFDKIRNYAGEESSAVSLTLAAGGVVDLADELLGRAVNFTGSSGNDGITTSNGNDTLQGGLGNDSLQGGLGNDTIDGGEKGDWLTGGSNLDTFVFKKLADSNYSNSNLGSLDTISDFNSADDTFDVRALGLVDSDQYDVVQILTSTPLQTTPTASKLEERHMMLYTQRSALIPMLV